MKYRVYMIAQNGQDEEEVGRYETYDEAEKKADYIYYSTDCTVYCEIERIREGE